MPSLQGNPRLSKGNQAHGAIKSMPEDFIVREITADGTVLEPGTKYEGTGESIGKFTRFVLQKRNWNTMQALKAVAQASGKGIRSIGFAGTKDRTSVSVQMCSIFGVEPEKVLRTSIKDISINGAWGSGEGIKLGDLLGNRFSVRLRQAANAENLSGIEEELSGTFPNYYGEQRFGYRENNLNMGISLLKGDYRNALLLYLTDTTNEKMSESIMARERLADELDFQEALHYFPKHLKYERSVIEYLSRYPGSYLNALKRLPRHLLLMFVHSVESHIFNISVADRVVNGETRPIQGDYVCGKSASGFPDLSTARKYDGEGTEGIFVLGNLVGYGTEMLSEAEQKAMDDMGLSKEMFRMKGMPELSSKGVPRPIFAPYLGFRIIESDGPVLEFSLPNGSYATVLLHEFVNGHEHAD